MAATDGHGRTVAERQEVRDGYLRHAVEQATQQARHAGWTVRCKDADVNSWPDAHQICRGEDSRNGGCLCPCHDPIAEVVVR